jgi:predicted nucleotide-binding protein (sugar kinase/HSP70/actin superfamily)
VKRDSHDLAHVKRERIAIEHKGQVRQEHLESLEYTQPKMMVALVDLDYHYQDDYWMGLWGWVTERGWGIVQHKDIHIINNTDVVI